MRAKEFISELVSTSPQRLNQIKKANQPVSSVSTTGSISAVSSDDDQEDNTDQLASLGQEPEKEKKSPNPFLSTVNKGLKKGLGMDPDQGWARNLAAKSLSKMNMNNAANSVAQKTNVPNTADAVEPIGRGLDATQLSAFRVGTQINHPKLGLVRVKKSGPQGVTLDTRNALGHEISLSPAQIAAFSKIKK